MSFQENWRLKLSFKIYSKNIQHDVQVSKVLLFWELVSFKQRNFTSNELSMLISSRLIYGILGEVACMMGPWIIYIKMKFILAIHHFKQAH